MQIFIGADYRGFKLKEDLLRRLAQKSYNVTDLGGFSGDSVDDFNDPAIAVARAVRENPEAFGILICDSAHGVTMQANRFKGIRAAHCGTPESALLAREHDDANILCLSAHFVDVDTAESIMTTFLNTAFQSLERRNRRINRLDEREDYD